MQYKTKVDNYSILIVANYLKSKDDYINLVCVCKNFKKTLKKMRYNPIPVTSTKLFPYMQTHCLYSREEIPLVNEVDIIKICFPVSLTDYHHNLLKFKHQIKFTNVFFIENDLKLFKPIIHPEVNMLGPNIFVEQFLQLLVVYHIQYLKIVEMFVKFT